MAITAASFAASFFVSAFAQVWVGGRIHLPGAAAFALPVAIDAPLLAFGMAAIAKRSRGESTVLAWLSLSVFTAASIGANVWHGLEAGEPGSTVGQIGVVAVSALIPLGVLLTSESVLSIIVQPPQGSAEQRQALARVADRGLLGAAGAQAKPSAAEKQDAAAVAAAMVQAGATQAAARKATGVSVAALKAALGGRQPPTTQSSVAGTAVAEFRL
jgi:hypothetical protein